MKNLVRALCAALATLLLVLGFVACDGGHTHAYTIKNVDDAYVKNPATTSSPVEYYYSCSCGEKGTETFTFGSPLPGGSEDEGNTPGGSEDDTPGGAVDSLDPGLVFTKNSDNTTYTLSKYNGSASHVTIPSTYKGGKVTVIGNSAFLDCYLLTSVTIPDSIILINDSSFKNCISLAEVNIPNSVRLIGSYAFENCSALTKITVADSVTSIGYLAFSGCANVQEIEGAAFVFQHIPCEKLKKATITSGDISVEAFKGYSGLTSVTIGNSVTSIGSSAFSGCSGLESITLPFVGASKSATDADALFGYIFGTSSYTGGTETRQYYNSSSYITYYIPASLKAVTITGGSIGYGTFYNCSGLTSVTVPNSVTSIGDRAFYACSGLTSVTIPNSVTSIGSSVFSGCSGLTSVTIPNSVTSIGWSAFSGCSGLTSVTIPDSVTSIGSGAFTRCSGLTSVTIPNSVTSIESGAFSGCSSLTSVTIGNGVTSIGYQAFAYCSDLTSITVASGSKIYHSAGNCIIETASKTLIAGCKSSVIPADGSVTSIGWYAFYGCSGLTSVTIPDSVTSIGGYAFAYCSGLTSIKYRGSQSDWSKISKGNYWNSGTGNITITYNYTGE